MASPLAMGGGSMQQMQQQMMQNPEMVRQMMNSPLVEAMMNDPDMLQNMVQSNPQLKQMMESNPEVGHLLSDPAVLRQSLETARNPQLMREMMRNTDRAMSNIEAHPEGFNMLRRLYTNVQQPLSQLGQPSTSDDGPDVEPTASPTTPNTTALPNPWAPAPPSAAASPAGLFGAPRPAAGMPMRNPLAFAQMFGGAPGVPPPNRPPAAAGLDALAAPAGGAGAAFGAAPASGIGAPPQFQAALAQLQLQQAQAQMGQPAAAGPPAQLLQQLAQSNPAVQQMLRDPAFMQQVQRQVQARMGGAAPGAAPGAAAGAPPAPYDLGAMMQLLNQNGTLPGLAGGGVGAAAAAAAPPPAPAANPLQLYAAQLQTLTDMGFFDSDANLRALVSTGGNVQAAVERLLS